MNHVTGSRSLIGIAVLFRTHFYPIISSVFIVLVLSGNYCDSWTTVERKINKQLLLEDGS